MKDLVPYVKLTQIQTTKCLELLRQSNTLLKKWAECFGSRKGRDFRKMLFQGHKDAAVMAEVESRIPSSSLDDFRRERRSIIEIHVKTHADLGDRTVEFAMLSGYSAMARKHAKRWSNQNAEGGGMSLSDYLNEAYISLLEAIYSFTKDGISFSSFAWVALHNRMITVTNKSNPLCPLTNPDLELLAKYEDALRSFNDHVTFDEVAAVMGLDEEQCKILGSIMTRVYAESQIKDQDMAEANNDYTGLRQGMQEGEKTRYTQLSVRDAIHRARLTDFERLVLDASLEPYYGWQSDLARNSVNPETGSPYSRMWVGLALKSAHEKVKSALLRTHRVA